MPPKRIAARREERAAHSDHLAKAEEFLRSALENLASDRWNAAALSAVHAGIAAADAVLVFERGRKGGAARAAAEGSGQRFVTGTAVSRRLTPTGVLLGVLVSAFPIGLAMPAAISAEEIIFLQDGRTIQAEKTEIVGDRVRIERPAETIELPRSAVLSIHPVTPPTASPNVPPPAEAYRDMSQQMTDKVRREIQQQPGAPHVK